MNASYTLPLDILEDLTLAAGAELVKGSLASQPEKNMVVLVEQPCGKEINKRSTSVAFKWILDSASACQVSTKSLPWRLPINYILVDSELVTKNAPLIVWCYRLCQPRAIVKAPRRRIKSSWS